MPLILHIETATDVCSVALALNGVLVNELHASDARSHATQLTLLIQEICKQSSLPLSQLDAVAVSKGPGSYTGLRIGVATAKGICYALDKPLIGISTLHSFTHELWLQKKSIASQLLPTDLICPMIDARRMEVYAALFNAQNTMVREIQAEIITDQSFEHELKKQQIFFFGDGAAKCKALLQHNKNAIFIDDFIPSSRGQIKLALLAYQQKQFEDVAYFEPFYLKEFVGFNTNQK